MDDSSTTNSPKSIPEKETPQTNKKEKISETKQLTRNSTKENGKVEKERQNKKSEKDKAKEDQSNDVKQIVNVFHYLKLYLNFAC